MKVIVGLGNPGRQYENTRHNIGFIAIDRIAEKLGIQVNRSKFRSTVGEGVTRGEKVLLAKPETYMNDSGLAVHDIMDFYKLEPEDLIVVYQASRKRQVPESEDRNRQSRHGIERTRRIRAGGLQQGRSQHHGRSGGPRKGRLHMLAGEWYRPYHEPI